MAVLELAPEILELFTYPHEILHVLGHLLGRFVELLLCLLAHVAVLFVLVSAVLLVLLLRPQPFLFLVLSAHFRLLPLCLVVVATDLLVRVPPESIVHGLPECSLHPLLL